MKKNKRNKIVALVSLLFIAGSLFYTNNIEIGLGNERGLSSGNFKIFVDGNPVTLNSTTGTPVLDKETTIVPIRVVSENMGYEVDYNSSAKKVTISDEKNELVLTIGSKTALVNGKSNTLLAPAKIISERTYVPLRFISENMGATVDYKVGGDGYKYILIARAGEVQKPVEVPTIPPIPATPPSSIGKGETPVQNPLTTSADYSAGGWQANIEKLRGLMGSDLDDNLSGRGMVAYNPFGFRDGLAFYVVNRPNEAEDVVIGIKDWYRPADHDGLQTTPAYKKINPMVKEVLKFYLPDGYEKLYQIIDDGYNARWDKASNYLDKDISKMIGSSKKVVLVDGAGVFEVKIGSGTIK